MPNPNDQIARLNQAVDECLGRCSQASTPPNLTVEGYCRELQQERGWDNAEVQQVREIVTRALVRRAIGQ